jgi:uncharacterized protein (DUF433 family)
MSFIPEPMSVPLAEDKDGVIRVGGTRVTLDTVAEAFGEGASPEEIVQQYPSLQLVDVYAVIGYMLQHQAEVDAYLAARRQRRADQKAQNEAQHDPTGIRERLLARRISQE